MHAFRGLSCVSSEEIKSLYLGTHVNLHETSDYYQFVRSRIPIENCTVYKQTRMMMDDVIILLQASSSVKMCQLMDMFAIPQTYLFATIIDVSCCCWWTPSCSIFCYYFSLVLWEERYFLQPWSRVPRCFGTVLLIFHLVCFDWLQGTSCFRMLFRNCIQAVIFTPSSAVTLTNMFVNKHTSPIYFTDWLKQRRKFFLLQTADSVLCKKNFH